MIAIDVGCASHGDADSIGKIIEEYQPSILFGFDPFSSVQFKVYRRGDTFVVEAPLAVWTFHGQVGYIEAGLRSYSILHGAGRKVDCIDLALLVRACHIEGEVLLKIDAEGAEYDLLRHLTDTHTDNMVAVAWIEWHQPDRGRAEIEAMLGCGELREWDL